MAPFKLFSFFAFSRIWMPSFFHWIGIGLDVLVFLGFGFGCFGFLGIWICFLVFQDVGFLVFIGFKNELGFGWFCI